MVAMDSHETETPNEFRRAQIRKRVAVRAKLRVMGMSYPVGVVDVSPTGFRFESMTRFAPGLHVTLTLPTFEAMGAKLIWMDHGLGGAHFDRPLHPAVTDAIAARHAVLAPIY